MMGEILKAQAAAMGLPYEVLARDYERTAASSEIAERIRQRQARLEAELAPMRARMQEVSRHLFRRFYRAEMMPKPGERREGYTKAQKRKRLERKFFDRKFEWVVPGGR
jgi:hypothetical protein